MMEYKVEHYQLQRSEEIATFEELRALKIDAFYLQYRFQLNRLLSDNYLCEQGFQPPMLIFVQSKERAKELFHELIYDGINVEVIHSERTQTQVRHLSCNIVFYKTSNSSH